MKKMHQSFLVTSLFLIFLHSRVKAVKKVRYLSPSLDTSFPRFNRRNPQIDEFLIKEQPTIRRSSFVHSTSVSVRGSGLSQYCLKPQGQFEYAPDCHSFVNCWERRATLQRCHPTHLVFEHRRGQCVKESPQNPCGSTQADENDRQSYCINRGNYEYACVRRDKCVRGQFVTNSNRRRTYRSSERIVFPSPATENQLTKCLPGYMCCRTKRRTKPRTERKRSDLLFCPGDYTGTLPVDGNCSSFIQCWKGRMSILSCAPGTLFDTHTRQCDFPHKAHCDIRNDTAPGIIDIFDPNSIIQVARSGRSSLPKVHSAPVTSGQRIRLRGGKAPYTGYLELSHLDEWGFVCDSGSWTLEEANLVCRQLGFTRGVRSTTQGLVHGPINDKRKITESVDCSGSEKSLEKCSIRYSTNRNSICKSEEGIVSITCIPDSLASCREGEIPWGGSCYSLHFNKTSFHDAQATCRASGQHLVEITSQEENDLISELLLHNSDVLNNVWTGGFGSRTARAAAYFWHGSSTHIGYRNWWPGWNGQRKGNSGQLRGNAMGIKIGRTFDYINAAHTRESRLTDYYFWALEDLRTSLAFVCERNQNEVGCLVEESGKDYRGFANRGESGAPCLPWNSTHLSTVLDASKIPNLGPLEGNNFCRNPDGDSSPWCIAPNGEFDYCDILLCKQEVHSTKTLPSSKCPPGHFQCSPGNECILKEYMCDGYRDCENGADEEECSNAIDELEFFDKREESRLDVPFLERWLHLSPKACAHKCTHAKDFTCKSFNYHTDKRLCVLNDKDVGNSGTQNTDVAWTYFEKKEGRTICESEELTCPSKKCLRSNQLCDGKNDCGDHFDEGKCEDKPNVQLRLVGGKGSHEGRIEIKAFDHDFGGICDDGFNIDEANVICRMLGYRHGAKEAILNSNFGFGFKILLDELHCVGNESTILDCAFDPWTAHDCTQKEWAGVVCKVPEKECQEEEWKCRSGDCVPLDLLCDHNPDCTDESDESHELCRSPVKVRLADGNNQTSGRVEIHYKGVWGTICDDNFGPAEGEVVCRMLGHANAKAIVHSEASFNQGKGPIWIENIQCKGSERSLEECTSTGWNPSYRCKHVEDVGVECIPQREMKIKFGNRFGGETVQCGRSSVAETAREPIARIAAGLQSRPGTQPWAASIRLRGNENSYHWCGAVVISEFHVLTVAHCMEDYPKEVYRVRVGDWDMQVKDVQEQDFEVESVHFHEEYNVGKYLNNDIVLIRVKAKPNKRGIVFGSRVIPICLPHANVVHDPRLNCTVSGWGSTGISKPGFTRYLQSARIPYLETEKCMAKNVYGESKLSSGMFCAGFLDGGVDTCQGDSGGGLICDTGEGQSALLGLTSWGYGCGRPNRPGVYTKIVNYLDWIVDKMII